MERTRAQETKGSIAGNLRGFFDIAKFLHLFQNVAGKAQAKIVTAAV